VDGGEATSEDGRADGGFAGRVSSEVQWCRKENNRAFVPVREVARRVRTRAEAIVGVSVRLRGMANWLGSGYVHDVQDLGQTVSSQSFTTCCNVVSASFSGHFGTCATARDIFRMGACLEKYVVYDRAPGSSREIDGIRVRCDLLIMPVTHISDSFIQYIVAHTLEYMRPLQILVPASP
jgi:hypothetical protein